MANGKNFNRRGGYTHAPEVYTPTDDELGKIIINGDAVVLNQVCDKLGKDYAEGRDNEKLSTSQIRRVFDQIQRMDDYNQNQLQLLRPMLAYAAGRASEGNKVKNLQRLMERAIPMVNENNFKNFVNFFEAIVAYHRFHGGK